MSLSSSRWPCLHWLLLLLLRTHASAVEEASGNVGCLFDNLVCAEDELCSDEEVIGVCVSASSSHRPRWLPMGADGVGALEAEMTRVAGLGFDWPHPYTQCVFQTLLHHIRNRRSYSSAECSQLMAEPDQLGEPLVSDKIMQDTDGKTYNNPGEYIEEDDDGMEEDEEEPSPEEQARAWMGLQQVLESLQTPESPEYFYEGGDDQPIVLLEPPESENIDDKYTDYIPEEYFEDTLPYAGAQEDQEEHGLEKRNYAATSYNLLLPQGDEEAQADLYNLIQPDREEYFVPDNFESLYNTPAQLYDAPFDDAYVPQSRELSEDAADDADDDDDLENEEDIDWAAMNAEEEDLRRKKKRQVIQPRPTFFTQDVYPTDEDNDDPEDARDVSNYDFDYEDSSAAKDEDNDDILYYNNDSGEPMFYNNKNEPIPVESVFDRRERLDVKKPGPFFANSPNNFFLDKLVPENFDGERAKNDDDDDENNAAEETGEDVSGGQTEYELPLSDQTRPKKSGDAVFTIKEPGGEENTLTINYNRLSLEAQVEELISMVADHLGLQPSVFSLAKQPKSSQLELVVHANPRNLNATTMADLLNADVALADHANNHLGINIKGFEAGSKGDIVTRVSTGGLTDRTKLLLIVLLGSLVAAAIGAALGLFLMLRRRGKKISEVEENREPEKEEPVKEYKQLVRDWSRSSRASQGSVSNGAKGENGQESPLAGKRVHKISGGQNSEGSRTSSTSSWQEEPSATTMDISTGHMVLSYMEDHLKNKQRLEQEWVGLCAYEAEPNSTAIAFKVENKKKNRYPDKLPYDHNRVLLNAMVNGTNSDFINASTVMDHDPRNPAYIVTQGPMAHTVADFWQMVWEQGSVVLVMLSRLSENGYQLAHRYWPEEGSEQYHIFEVHLVSEHVWCDDYLVRSLYLKNTQTGETRTVTQFHFLSWADGTIPTSTRAILEFRRKVNKSYRGRSCPIIIHCSDGVGRSGTYVLIDMVLNRMTKGSKEIDIAATLEHIRDQRSGMVQTRSQFEFCLMAVAEETHAILKALPQ